MFEKIIRFWNTVKFLKPLQIYGRPWFKSVKPSINIALLPPPMAKYSGVWVPSAEKQCSAVENDSFSFLGGEGSLAEVKWEGAEREDLWRYNQHYFDFLGSAENVSHKDSAYSIPDNWLKHVAPRSGEDWEPYPTSLSVVKWVKWSLEGNKLPVGFDASLAMHGRWLMKRLEYHLSGNHLFANAKALCFLGLYFDNSEAQQWLKKGLSIIEVQIQEQILLDGDHFELSPMYHAIAFKDILDLTNLANCYRHKVSNDFQTAVAWRRCMTHPEDGLAFFNDSAEGIAPKWSELESYHHRMMDSSVNIHSPPKPELLSTAPSLWAIAGDNVRYEHFNDSGYVNVQADESSAIVDVGAIGPDYFPGHAHADTLSFELSFKSQRIFVNSGTSCYGASAEPVRQRGTSAHNSVEMDGKDTSEVRRGFRVARRARIKGLKVTIALADNDYKRNWAALTISASHNRYMRLDGKPVHTGHWIFSERNVSVPDEISGQFKKAYARYHFHPEVKLFNTNTPDECKLEYALGKYAKLSDNKDLATMEQSTWRTKFGVSVSSQCSVVQLMDSQSQLVFSV